MNNFTLVVFAIAIGAFLYGLSIGMDFVVVPIMFADSDLTKTQMGILFGIELSAPLIFAPLLTKIIPKFGIQNTVTTALVARNATLAFIPFFDEFYQWIPMQFVFGAGGFCLFLTLQLWLNNICSNDNRAMVLGILNAALSFGIAVGPMVLNYTGTTGTMPLIVSSALCTIMIIPVALVFKYAPTIDKKPTLSILQVVKNFPVAIGGGILVDYIFFSLSSFLVLYGMDHGLLETDAAFLITAMLAATIVLDIPIGWISDRMDRSLLMMICTTLILLVSQILTFTIDDTLLVVLTFTIWCGAMGGIYNSSLALIGDKYQKDNLTAANSAFAFMNCLGSMLGVFISGIMIDTFGSNGLTISIGGACAIYLLMNIVSYKNKKSLHNKT